MFDDVSRNFIMNPQNGLKIKPFRDAHFTRDEDRELIQLARYVFFLLVEDKKKLP